MIIAGNTHLYKTLYAAYEAPKIYISLNAVTELKNITEDDKVTTVGAAMNFADAAKSLANSKNAYAVALSHAMLDVAGPHVQSTATLGGLIASRVRYSEVLALLIACGANIVMAADNKVMTVESYLAAADHGLIKSIVLARAPENTAVTVKIGSRWEYQESRVVMATAITAAADFKIMKASIAAGGVCRDADVSGYCLFTGVSNMMIGKDIKAAEKLFDEVAEAFIGELPLNQASKYGLVEYRRICALGLVLKCLVGTSAGLKTQQETPLESLIAKDRLPLTAHRDFEDSKYEELGKPLPLCKATVQAAGEHIFVDDVNLPANTLHGGFVLSPHSYARVTKIDCTEVCLEILCVYHI